MQGLLTSAIKAAEGQKAFRETLFAPLLTGTGEV